MKLSAGEIDAIIDGRRVPSSEGQIALASEVKALREALKPFANYAVRHIRRYNDDWQILIPDTEPQPKLADFDAARSALAKPESDVDVAQVIATSWLGDMHPKHREVLTAEIREALTAARIEGERAGLERAATLAETFEGYDAVIAEAIRALAKELPHDHD